MFDLLSPSHQTLSSDDPSRFDLASGALTRRLVGLPLDALGQPGCHYWPCELLNAFSLQMAAHGICVNASMMLGDAGYAHQKLSQAQALADASVNELVARMRAYFECAASSAEPLESAAPASHQGV